jgi:hypothetical protein
MHPDPFANIDPLWEPFTLSPSSAEFAMPDTTASGLRDFLRSDEVQKALTATHPPAPKPAVGWRLGHITGFPD